MKIVIETEVFMYLSEDSISVSLYLSDEQSEPYVYTQSLESLVDHIFDMETVPSTLKISKDGHDEVTSYIKTFRELAQKMEDKLATYKLMKERK